MIRVLRTGSLMNQRENQDDEFVHGGKNEQENPKEKVRYNCTICRYAWKKIKEGKITVLVKVAISVIKHYDPKQCGKRGFVLFTVPYYKSSLKAVRVRTHEV